MNSMLLLMLKIFHCAHANILKFRDVWCTSQMSLDKGAQPVVRYCQLENRLGEWGDGPVGKTLALCIGVRT